MQGSVKRRELIKLIITTYMSHESVLQSIIYTQKTVGGGWIIIRMFETGLYLDNVDDD